MHPVHSDQEASPLALLGVDASLVGLCTPYQVFQPEDTIFKSTMAAIEQTIHRPEGGVYRYLGDTYYGGGEWVLLAAWMGWHYARAGKLDSARALREWVESQADGEGLLPEQVNEHTLAPQYYDPWLKKWGSVATPLLWSHAMYILLVNATQQEQDSSK
jgi:GH15 family glucan-1,4-alpha-glucosidase